MKKILLLTMISLPLSAIAYEVPIQGPPDLVPSVKEWAKAYGVPEDMVEKMPKELFKMSQGTLKEKDFKSFEGLAEDLCNNFKDAEITFHVGLNGEGKLAIVSSGLTPGFKVKVKC